MNPSIRCLILASTLAALAQAGNDLSSFGEGAPARRQALAALEGKPAPALQVVNWVNSTPLSLAELKGKIVVLDFWGVWCGPCIASIPHNNELAAKYRDAGVIFVGVCHPRDVEKMEATVKEKGLKYATAQDPASATIKAYKVDSYPDYYLIDRQGILRVADCANNKVEAAIKQLLAEK